MPTLTNLKGTRLKALRSCVESHIDMLNDMAVDPLWFNVTQLRELAGKSDEEIRSTMSANAKEVYENIDMLVELRFIQSDLNQE